jgi:starch synthase (maltosyl-transferring)
MLIYNLFPLLAGEFTAWDTHIIRAAKMGFDWLYINPIQQSGRSRSLYSIADYYAFDGRFIDKKSTLPPEVQLRNAINCAHDCGLNVMIDLVINHCAIDSELTSTQPGWFKWEHGRIINPGCLENGHRVTWNDLAQFNHNDEWLYRYIHDVCAWLLWLGFDGFRCDAAYMVPQEFWRRLIAEIKKMHPNAKFAAETLGCTVDETIRTAQAGFDVTFNSAKWWDYKEDWLLKMHERTRHVSPSISFPETHDTERFMKDLNGNTNAAKLKYLFTALFATGIMIPYGFEWGFWKRLHVVNTTPADCTWTGIDLSPFITNVNALKKSYVIFNRDTHVKLLNDTDVGDKQIVALMKSCPESNEEAIILMNTDVSNNRHVRMHDCRRLFRNGAKVQVATFNHTTDALCIDSIGHDVMFHRELKPGASIVIMGL